MRVGVVGAQAAGAGNGEGADLDAAPAWAHAGFRLSGSRCRHAGAAACIRACTARAYGRPDASLTDITIIILLQIVLKKSCVVDFNDHLTVLD
jgi:hypothetical protein